MTEPTISRQRDGRTLRCFESRRLGSAAGSEDREGDLARGKTVHFLLTYDRSERRLVNMERFHNGRKVADAYGEREREFADRPHIEIVLLGADSEEAIRVTHSIDVLQAWGTLFSPSSDSLTNRA